MDEGISWDKNGNGLDRCRCCHRGVSRRAQAALKDAELNLQYSAITAPIGGRIGAHTVSIGNLVTGGSGTGTTLLTTIVSLNPIHFIFDISEAELLGYRRAVAEGGKRARTSALL